MRASVDDIEIMVEEEKDLAHFEFFMAHENGRCRLWSWTSAHDSLIKEYAPKNWIII